MKKIEDRIKRFGKVEPVEETVKRDRFRKNFESDKNNRNFFNSKIQKKEKKPEGSYLFIRKTIFDNNENESNEILNDKQIIPIRPKIFEEKKKEGFFNFNYKRFFYQVERASQIREEKSKN